MRVVATDSGGLSATATAVVQVNRNLNTPTWTRTSYAQTIDENFPLQSQILALAATDSDNQSPHNSLIYTIVSFNNNAANFFSISNTGSLVLTSSLVNTNIDTFTVIYFVNYTFVSG
jgi:hypothetical protein